MNKRYDQIKSEISTGKIGTIYFLHGNESYYIDQLINLFETLLPESQRSFNLHILYGKSVDANRIIDTASRYPMMAERQVVIVKEAQELKDFAMLEKYICKPVPTTTLIFAYKNKRLNFNTKAGRAIKNNGVLFESKRLYDNQIGEWIISFLKSGGWTIEVQAAELLSQYLGSDLSKITNEIEKLKVNVAKSEKISNLHIERYIGISREFNIFEFQKALVKKDYKKTDQILTYFKNNPKKNHIVFIVGSLYNYFSKVLQYKYVRNLNQEKIVKAMDLRSAWSLKDYSLGAKNYSLKALIRIIELLNEYDLRSKGINVSNEIADWERSENTSSDQLLTEMTHKILLLK